MEENKKTRTAASDGPEKKATFNQNSDKKVEIRTKQEILEMRKKAERIKGHYFRTFYYAFAISFIIFGMLAVVYFVYTQDKNFFGFSDKYYEEALALIESNDFESAEKALQDCLKLDPEYEKARIELIELYEKEQKYAECEALLEESIKLHSRQEYYYKKMISVLTAQNKVSQAIDFSSNISTGYIVVKLNEVRPQKPAAMPEPGTYDEAVTVKLTGSADATIYYTTDGSSPTKNSAVYDDTRPLTIEKGTATIRAIALNDEGLVSDEYSATYRIYNANTAYIFLDPKVEQMARAALNKPSGTIYYRELENIRQLSNTKRGDYEYTGEIKTLDDLLVMPNLSEVTLYNEPSIEDFSPLFQLKQLTSLTLSNCNMGDSYLRQFGTLIWLTSLNIDGNMISDISALKNMSALRTFSAANNMIRDISAISGLTNLKELNLSNNLIAEVEALSALTSLKSLDISYNLLAEVTPLASLTALTELNLSGNTVKQIDPLLRLTKLETLLLSDNPIQYLSTLSNFNNLTALKVDGTAVVSLDEIKNISSLTTLDCSRTLISDFSALASMNITNLTVMQSSIVYIETLALASSLEVLDISTNNVFDLAPLTHLENLKVLNISNNPSTNIGVLANCKALTSLSCANVPMTQDDFNALQAADVTIIQNN